MVVGLTPPLWRCGFGCCAPCCRPWKNSLALHGFETCFLDIQATYLTTLDISIRKQQEEGGEEDGQVFFWKVFQATPALASIEVFPLDNGTQLSHAIDQCCVATGRVVELLGVEVR